MEILTLNISNTGFTITNPSNAVVFSQFSSFDGSAWNKVNIKIAADAAYNQFLTQAKTEVISALASIRYSHQITAIGVKDGYFNPTDENMSRLDALISICETTSGQLNHYSLEWKVDNTKWIELDISTAKALRVASKLQVQRAFSAEYTHFKAITAITTFADLAVYDYTKGWETVPEVAVI